MAINTIHYVLIIIALSTCTISVLLLLASTLLARKTYAPERRKKTIKLVSTLFPCGILSLAAIPFTTLCYNYLHTQDRNLSIALRLRHDINGKPLVEAAYTNNKVVRINNHQPIILPAEQKIHILLQQTDRASSWWKPSMNFKMSLPGNIRETWMHTYAPQQYKSHCGPMCGDGFANLKFKIKIEQQRQYKKWLSSI